MKRIFEKKQRLGRFRYFRRARGRFAADVRWHRAICPFSDNGCEASLTIQDFIAGYCTNCGRKL